MSFSSMDKENTPPKHKSHSTRVSPRTPPQVIKIGKHTGRYKTSTMPIYHLTTPNSDTESDATEPKLLPPIDFIPSSTTLLADVTTREVDRTSKWLEDIVKFTMTPTEDTKSERSLERKNTINVKQHRVFSTSVVIHPRDSKSATPPQIKEEIKRKRKGREGVAEEQPSSWIASEIFIIAQNQAVGSLAGSKSDERQIKVAEDRIKTVESESVYGAYDDIESLMGDYFEDLKERGSDCGEE
jgi:hypothetical protein